MEFPRANGAEAATIMPLAIPALLAPTVHATSAVFAPLFPAFLLAQSATPLEPAGILVLCVIAGIGTFLLLPSAKPAPTRRLGGVLLAVGGAILAALMIRWAAGSASGAPSAVNPAAGVTGISGIYFWLFAAIALFGAVRVITHSRPVYSALYFVLTVFATAGLFLLLQAEFMAAALVLIYAGAILITYVFVIMLAAQASPGGTGALAGLAEHDAISREPFVATLVGFTLMGVILFVIFDKYQTPTAREAAVGATELASAAPGQGIIPPELTGSTQQLGSFLFEHYLISLELAGMILTVSMVGAIIIARRRIGAAEAAILGPEQAAIDADFSGDLVIGPSTPLDDNPHSVPVYGTRNPRQKAYPET